MKKEQTSVLDLVKIAGPKLFSEIFGVDIKQYEKFFNYLNSKSK